MTPASLTIIDGARLTEERARAARGIDAPVLASLVAVIAFAIGCGLIAIAAGA
ncbi:hypothetical protein [Hoeflea alexandrii]|uniref:Uncharacterized protein n=1 Tax=Hoeflea alexandrii TaxID=288436 RepID=A0ABT1CV32_9HYPH|nr:hypothetical protein [Hoeflea alexandrii]MCO6410067.1 hypothetical protein [Hoeflea alexandrii]MCY0153039.1 hypothetical protein [Hoeflea alexandrii]